MAGPTETVQVAVEEKGSKRRFIMKTRHHLLLVLLLGAAGSSGCAAVALTMFGVGAGLSANTGSSYILDSTTYKTFPASEEGLRAATLKTLKRMDIKVTEDEATESGRSIVGVAGTRKIEIELDRMTTRTSRMRVVAKQGLFFRDRATAEEIIVQTEWTLDNETRKAILTAAAPKQGAAGTRSPGEQPKEASQPADPAAKSTWDKVKDGTSAVGSSVKNTFSKLFGN